MRKKELIKLLKKIAKIKIKLPKPRSSKNRVWQKIKNKIK